MSSYDAEPGAPDCLTDEIVARWLDETSADGWSLDRPSDIYRAADLAFLDALLEQVHQPEPGRSTRRVARVLAALSAEPAARARRAVGKTPHWRASRRPRVLTGVMTLAAALLVGIGALYWLGLPARVAEAAVQQAFRTASEEKDRQYAVHTRVRTMRGELTEFDALLYVRGSSHFALHHPGFLGDLWIGGNGTHYWIKPAIGPAQIVDRLQRPLRWAETDAFGLPELRMTELLSFLVADYDLTFVGDEPAGDGSSTLWRHVRGLHRLGSNERPDIVDLWANPESGVACRLQLLWNREPVAAGLEHVTLDLVGEATQDSTWYDPASHGIQAPSLPRSPLLVPSGE